MLDFVFWVVAATRKRGCSIADIPERRHPNCEVLLIRPLYRRGCTVPCGSRGSDASQVDRWSLEVPEHVPERRSAWVFKCRTATSRMSVSLRSAKDVVHAHSIDDRSVKSHAS